MHPFDTSSTYVTVNVRWDLVHSVTRFRNVKPKYPGYFVMHHQFLWKITNTRNNYRKANGKKVEE